MPRRVGLLQRPGLLAGEVAVGVADHAPRSRSAPGGCAARPSPRAHGRQQRVGRVEHRRVGRGRARPGAGSAAGAVACAIIDSERWARLPRSLARSALMRLTIAVVADSRRPAERHLAQEEVADLVDAVMLDQRERVDDVADRLRHLLAAVEQEPCAKTRFGSGRSGGHQEGRPVDRVEADDVLADHMDSRPAR